MMVHYDYPRIKFAYPIHSALEYLDVVRLCNIFITFFIDKGPNVSAPHMILKAKGTIF